MVAGNRSYRGRVVAGALFHGERTSRLSTVRSDVKEIASEFCGRKGKTFRGISETAAKPPFIFGNFPRVELIFECIAKPTIAGSAPDSGKYEKIAVLKKLLDSGALTQQEFEVEKAKVLSAP